MVLPGRIELTTSPLPRGCSTTELRQRRYSRGGGIWPSAAGPCKTRLDGPGAVAMLVAHAARTPRLREAAPGTKPAAKAARLAREAAALRANLHKRKDQARERAAADSPPKQA